MLQSGRFIIDLTSFLLWNQILRNCSDEKRILLFSISTWLWNVAILLSSNEEITSCREEPIRNHAECWQLDCETRKRLKNTLVFGNLGCFENLKSKICWTWSVEKPLKVGKYLVVCIAHYHTLTVCDWTLYIYGLFIQVLLSTVLSQA